VAKVNVVAPPTATISLMNEVFSIASGFTSLNV